MDDEPAPDKPAPDNPLTAAEWDALPPVLTAEQVARVVGVKPAQVLRWANAGTFPGLNIGRQWRFSKDALADSAQPDAGWSKEQGSTDQTSTD